MFTPPVLPVQLPNVAPMAGVVQARVVAAPPAQAVTNRAALPPEKKDGARSKDPRNREGRGEERGQKLDFKV